MRTKFNAILLIAVGLLFATTFTALAADQKAKKDKKSKKEKVEYIGTTGVPKADPDVFLSLNGGIFTLTDKTSPSYVVSWQADDRLPKKFDGKIGWVVTVKSGAEINMDEELFQCLLKEVEKDNNALKRYNY